MRVLLALGHAFAIMAVMPALANAEFGTASEARAMLDRAVAEVRVDKRSAIERFNHNEIGFRDRDLFVFCFNAADGIFTAHEAMVAHDVRRLRDAAGTPFGEQMFAAASEQQITRISYLWPRPGFVRPAVKDAYVARVADQVCGVSVYRDEGSGHAN